MRVLKFGGSSLANADRFLRAAEIVINNSQQSQVAVVLSAPAKVTNNLVAVVRLTSEGADAASHLNEIEQIFNGLMMGIKETHPNLNEERLKIRLQQELDGMRQLLKGVSLLRQCPANIEAKILSRGEALSIAFMEQLLKARGHYVEVIKAEQKLLGIGGFLEASVDIETSRARFEQEGIKADHIYLMPGFTAGNARGETVVLGRNGSDYSAAVLAACLRAECCEIWTDVDGVYNCDPRLVPDAKLLKSLSYQEAMELSYFGAKVLHPKTIAPIAQHHIPCLIKNSFNPQGEGTLIGAESIETETKVKAISDLSGLTMFNVSGPGMKGMVGMAGRIFSAMSRSGVSVVLITQSSSEYSISFCIHSVDSGRAKDALEQEFMLELENQLLDPIEMLDELSIISLIGDGLYRAGAGVHQHRGDCPGLVRAFHLGGGQRAQGSRGDQILPSEFLQQEPLHRPVHCRLWRSRRGTA